MKKQFIEELAAQLVAAALDDKTLPINTGKDYCWQDFALVSDEEEDELAAKSNIVVSGTIYGTGNISLTISVQNTQKNEDTMRDAYKKLKAKNLVLCYQEKLQESGRIAQECSEMLEQIASYLGLTTEQALEMVNKKEEKQ